MSPESKPTPRVCSITDGLSIGTASAWILGTLVVWLGALLAGLVIPFFGLRKFLDARR